MSITASSGERLMTVGELSRRTGLSVKAIREYEALGLIYSAGRSEGNYRLFDDSALWCARVIDELRSLGLMIKEIQQLARAYLADDEPFGPRLAALLGRSERRIAARMADLRAMQRRIRAYRAANGAALRGEPGADLAASDPRRADSGA